jgi:hypothetical protein
VRVAMQDWKQHGGFTYNLSSAIESSNTWPPLSPQQCPDTTDIGLLSYTRPRGGQPLKHPKGRHKRGAQIVERGRGDREAFSTNPTELPHIGTDLTSPRRKGHVPAAIREAGCRAQPGAKEA